MFSESTSKFFITRNMYNDLITAFPEYMADNWAKLNRQWLIGGVIVTEAANSGLATLMNSIN